jgi:hypothetical protein
MNSGNGFLYIELLFFIPAGKSKMLQKNAGSLLFAVCGLGFAVLYST